MKVETRLFVHVFIVALFTVAKGGNNSDVHRWTKHGAVIQWNIVQL